MRNFFLILGPFLLFLLSFRSNENLPPGVQKLHTEHNLSLPQQIEVREFVWLGCLHCRKFHSSWTKIKEQFGDRANFLTVPAVFDNWYFDARIFVSMEQLGLIDDELMANYLEARQGNDAPTLSRDPKAVAKWLTQHYDVSQQAFLNMFQSDAVDSKLLQLKSIQQQYPIDAVPAVLISVPDSQTTYFVPFEQLASTSEAIVNLLQQLLPK